MHLTRFLEIKLHWQRGGWGAFFGYEKSKNDLNFSLIPMQWSWMAPAQPEEKNIVRINIPIDLPKITSHAFVIGSLFIHVMVTRKKEKEIS